MMIYTSYRRGRELGRFVVGLRRIKFSWSKRRDTKKAKNEYINGPRREHTTGLSGQQPKNLEEWATGRHWLELNERMT
jgi:hypothetical protein